MIAYQSATLIERLVASITIMDERGRSNYEYNSNMLWFEEWEQLRTNLVDCLDSRWEER